MGSSTGPVALEVKKRNTWIWNQYLIFKASFGTYVLKQFSLTLLPFVGYRKITYCRTKHRTKRKNVRETDSQA